MQTLYSEGNLFSGRAFPVLIEALTHESLLFKLHLGALRCTETELHELIRDGV